MIGLVVVLVVSVMFVIFGKDRLLHIRGKSFVMMAGVVIVVIRIVGAFLLALSRMLVRTTCKFPFPRKAEFIELVVLAVLEFPCISSPPLVVYPMIQRRVLRFCWPFLVFI